MRTGFSLVELSIVLVILGLLTGGILAGQNLIRAAELRSVVTEFQSYQTAVRTFQGKYFSLPGDMPNATDFWGAPGNNTANCPATAGTGSQTCNGDGDGVVDINNVANQYDEPLLFWQHLANSGLIEGSYTGIAGGAGTGHTIPGVNGPRSKISSSGWGARHVVEQSGDVAYFDGEYNNILVIGSENSTMPNQPLFIPEEVWGIDTKIDDGLPALGKVSIRRRSNCALDSSGVVHTPADGADDMSSTYNLANTDKNCTPVFRKVF